MRTLSIVLLLVLVWSHSGVSVEADVPAETVRIGDDEKKTYVRIGPMKGAKRPAKGHPLLLIMPGGDGSADFQAFCQRIYKNACPEGWVAAQLVAPKWRDGQKIVWPTAKSKVKGMRFTTESFIDDVIEDVSEWKRIDDKRIAILGWSSSGPAIYAYSFGKKPKAKRYFIAMSVFKPKELTSKPSVRGKSWYVLHSPEDRVCPHRMAQEAETFLKKRKARVTLVTYAGGHGWHGNVYGHMRKGLDWLDEK